MRTLLLLVPLLAFASFMPAAEAAQPPPQCIQPGSGCCFAPCQPLVGVCVDDVNRASCDDGSWICVGFSYQVPQCVDHLSVECTEVCNPCVKIDCDPGCETICSICNTMECVPNPCETRWFDCMPVFEMSGPEPMCMYYYYEIDTGIVRYVQRDSCHSEIYVDGERVK